MKLSTQEKKLHIMKIKICDHVKAFVFSLFIQRSYKAEYGSQREDLLYIFFFWLCVFFLWGGGGHMRYTE